MRGDPGKPYRASGSTGPCGKMGYPTRAAARKVVRALKGRGLHIYRCPDKRCCARPFHLTSQPKAKA